MVLIVAGIAALVHPRISYRNRESVLEVGPIKATAETQKTIPISPVISVGGIVAGIALLLITRKKSI